MHAIGANAAAVRRMVISEGIFTALASCLAAAIPALALTAVMSAGMGTLFMDAPLPFRVSAPAAGIYRCGRRRRGHCHRAPASRASRLSVREALAHP